MRTAEELIEEAMTGVRIVLCDYCEGDREIGLPSLRGTCPYCQGGGRTTTNDLEVTSDAD